MGPHTGDCISGVRPILPLLHRIPNILCRNCAGSLRPHYGLSGKQWFLHLFSNLPASIRKARRRGCGPSQLRAERGGPGSSVRIGLRASPHPADGGRAAPSLPTEAAPPSRTPPLRAVALWVPFGRAARGGRDRTGPRGQGQGGVLR